MVVATFYRSGLKSYLFRPIQKVVITSKMICYRPCTHTKAHIPEVGPFGVNRKYPPMSLQLKAISASKSRDKVKTSAIGRNLKSALTNPLPNDTSDALVSLNLCNCQVRGLAANRARPKAAWNPRDEDYRLKSPCVQWASPIKSITALPRKGVFIFRFLDIQVHRIVRHGSARKSKV